MSDGDEVNTYSTNPLEPDTDFDGLSDADEIALGTSPNLPDTDGDGTPDGQERFAQTYVYDVVAEDCPVEQVIVSMEGTGNLQNTMSVENIMDKDFICSGVVGLVGVPFSIETTSDFETATLSFQIDQSKLGDTDFNDLLFLWYDEENYQFVELETTYDEANSLVSVQTTHFSRYMVVDKYQWFEAWAQQFNYNPGKTESHAPTIKYNTVLAIDCSGSMNGYDPITNNATSSEYDGKYYARSCQRIKAAQEFINNMNIDDRAAIVLFDSNANIITPMTNDLNSLKLGLQSVYSSGGTNFYAALQKSYEVIEGNLDESNVYNRIILLSDGEDSDSLNTNKLLQTIYGESSVDKRKSVKIYTVGLGSSYDYNLKGIADKTGGDFYKAFTADELLEIYTNMGFEDDFDKTDTDGDGLYDAVEAAGIRIQNGQIIQGCDPLDKDTDKDGLTDGQEIDPTILRKHNYWGPPEMMNSTSGNYYFVMKSNPVNNDDTDRDGYSDIEDPDPLNKPEIIGDKYDFLDGEIYTIEALDTFSKRDYLDIQGSSADAGTSLIMYNYNGNDNQKFKFEWCGVGYKIHSLVNESLVLTMSLNSYGMGTLYMDYDNDEQEQIWEVLPYCNESKSYNGVCTVGIIIKSKVLYYDGNDKVGQPLYIHYNEDSTFVSSDRASGTRFIFNDISKWMRFGKVYMNYEGWSVDKPYADVARAMRNYKNNSLIGIGSDNKLLTSEGVETLIFQNGGMFPLLKFADANMDEVACEVIATYNALCIANGNNDIDFFKLAVEFELSAIQYNYAMLGNITSDFNIIDFVYYLFHDGELLLTDSNKKEGGLGSDPFKIENCLSAYNKQFSIIRISDYIPIGEDHLNNLYNSNACSDFESICKAGKSSIISFTFSQVTIHTSALTYDSSRTDGKYFIGYNRSGWAENTTWDDSSIQESIRENCYFYVGYVIY